VVVTNAALRNASCLFPPRSLRTPSLQPSSPMKAMLPFLSHFRSSLLLFLSSSNLDEPLFLSAYRFLSKKGKPSLRFSPQLVPRSVICHYRKLSFPVLALLAIWIPRQIAFSFSHASCQLLPEWSFSKLENLHPVTPGLTRAYLLCVPCLTHRVVPSACVPCFSHEDLARQPQFSLFLHSRRSYYCLSPLGCAWSV